MLLCSVCLTGEEMEALFEGMNSCKGITTHQYQTCVSINSIIINKKRIQFCWSLSKDFKWGVKSECGWEDFWEGFVQMSSSSHYKCKNKKEWKNEQGTGTQLKPVQHTERSGAEPRQWVLKQYGANWNTGHKPKNTQATSTQTLHFQKEFFFPLKQSVQQLEM